MRGSRGKNTVIEGFITDPTNETYAENGFCHFNNSLGAHLWWRSVRERGDSRHTMRFEKECYWGRTRIEMVQKKRKMNYAKRRETVNRGDLGNGACFCRRIAEEWKVETIMFLRWGRGTYVVGSPHCAFSIWLIRGHHLELEKSFFVCYCVIESIFGII